VLLVEWCPLEGPRPLADELADVVTSSRLAVRVVTVPREVAAARFDDAEAIALWIFAAKNVGIRRARAPFVLATNPDVLYTPALFRAIAGRPLDERSFYRVSRFDVAGVPLEAPPRRQLAACARSVVRLNLLGGSVRLDSPAGPVRVAREIRRYEEEHAEMAPSTREERIALPTHWLHTNASGDFFLMHRQRWHDLHGYPEFASAGHLDSYIAVMAASAGLQQVVLDGLRRRLYHLEHERAIDWERPEAASPYYVPYETFLADAGRMLSAGTPTRFAGDDWGLAGIELPEFVLG
jgi:hypothetical protein